MNRADLAVRLIGLTVAPTRRSRFVEEWSADLSAARALGLSPFEILLAAARVAGFLLRIRLRPAVLRQRSRGAVLAIGAGLGLTSVVVDVHLEALVPFVVIVLGRRCLRSVRAWVDGAA